MNTNNGQDHPSPDRRPAGANSTGPTEESRQSPTDSPEPETSTPPFPHPTTPEPGTPTPRTPAPGPSKQRTPGEPAPTPPDPSIPRASTPDAPNPNPPEPASPSYDSDSDSGGGPNSDSGGGPDSAKPRAASPHRPRSPWPSVPTTPYPQASPPGIPSSPTPAAPRTPRARRPQDPPTTALRKGTTPHDPPTTSLRPTPPSRAGTPRTPGPANTPTRAGTSRRPGTPTPAGPPPSRGPRARADSGAYPTPQFHQHRQSPGDDSPDPARHPDLTGAALQEARRRRATGFTTGALHALGFTLLAVYEYFRTMAGSLSPAQIATGGPAELRHIASLQADLMRQNWYEAISELARILTFDQPRAVLWAAVLIAIVVRFNRSGPALVQIGLSGLAAGYCALLSVVWFPFLHGLGAPSAVVFALSGALLWATTRR
ncbi:hypothetical protein [Streptomyces sp. NPDC051561]|uniref:hypothetical protein n=1 Tax=Streptomyces sp. NPDC051561 TaxID=3365658 RepID=UPI00378D455B